MVSVLTVMAVMVVQFALPSLKDGTPGLGMPVCSGNSMDVWLNMLSLILRPPPETGVCVCVCVCVF